MKTSQVYRQALDHLWDGMTEQVEDKDYACQFICWCIVYAAGIKPHGRGLDYLIGSLPKVYRDAKDIIEERLLPDCTVPNWLETKGIPVHSLEYHERHRKVQAYRRQWLNALILEFEAKGD